MRSVARWVAYSLIFLLTLEALARLDDWVREGAPLAGNHDIDTVFVSAPGVKAGKPGAQFGKWQMNSLGFRGPEPIEGRRNILVYGASESFGIYESPDQEYPRQLARLLDAAQPGTYNVLNAAVPGLRIGRMGYLDRILQQAPASHLIVYPTPAAYIGVDKPFCDEPATWPSQLSTQDSPRARLKGKVELVAKQVMPEPVMTALKEFGIWRATREIQVIDRLPETALQAFEKDLRCVVERARRAGATPVLVTHGNYFGDQITPENRPMLVAWRRFYPDLSEAGFIDMEARANQVVQRVASSEPQAILVDIRQAVPPGPKHYADFVHFTDEGARLLAEQLSAAILAKPSSGRQP